VETTLTVYHLAFIFVLGTVFGSFINVVIYRLPRDASLVWPPSACPACGTRIRFYDNVPVLSYLLLRGRCRHCHGRISPRYPIVEVASGLLMVWVVAAGGPPGTVASRAVLVLFLLAIAIIDWEHMIIPDELSLGGCLVGFVLSFFNPQVPVAASLVGLIAGGAFFLAIGLIWRRLRGIEALGGGDVKLAAMIGAFLGWKGLAVCILGGSMAGSVYGLALMARGGGSQTRVPYGTFLAAGAVFAAFYAEHFLGWYTGLLRG
jgi:leader peptidase (prepilin peptidase)/N-methyltransferase